MTSIHMDSQPQTANGSSLNQSQTPSKFDEVERARQRMDGFRGHHERALEIHNRTQPIINDQIHEETIKFLRNGQVNGTKTKSQKPRAPKRVRNAPNNNNNNNNASSPVVVQTNTVVTSTTNGIPPQANQLQQNSVPTQGIILQPGPMQQRTLFSPRIQQQQQQQQSMHIQHTQHPHQMQTQNQQQQFTYQTSSGLYQQTQQPAMQAQHQYQAPQQQPQQIYSQTMQPQTHVLPQKIEQNHFVAQHPGQQQSHQHFAQHHNHLNGNHHTHHPHHHHQQSHLGQVPLTSLPNDLDLTLQAGLECDIDSLIKHEMSVEGQLDFNHDLLLKLDNHYQPHYQ